MELIIIMIYIVKKTGIFITHESVPYWIMVAITALTAFSGIRYLITNWTLFLPEGHEKNNSGSNK